MGDSGREILLSRAAREKGQCAGWIKFEVEIGVVIRLEREVRDDCWSDLTCFEMTCFEKFKEQHSGGVMCESWKEIKRCERVWREGDEKKRAAPGLPAWSPTAVLPRLDPA